MRCDDVMRWSGKYVRGGVNVEETATCAGFLEAEMVRESINITEHSVRSIRAPPPREMVDLEVQKKQLQRHESA